MKIFVDSADIDEIKQAYEWGVADGVTTNPSLMKKAVDKLVAKGEKVDLKSYLSEILKVAKGTPVSLEVTASDKSGMIEEGKKLFKIFNAVAGNVNIKVPVNPAFEDGDKTHFDGIAVIRELANNKIPINCTLVFTPEQALLAAKAGATFVSPFAGRIDDDIRKKVGKDFDKMAYFPMDGRVEEDKKFQDAGVVSGVDLVAQCVEILEHYNYPTEVLAASIRNPRQARECALVGAHIATLPFSVIENMLKHHKTFDGMKAFTKDIVKEYQDLTE